MQPLFSTELIIDQHPVLYHIVFENNQYQFRPEAAQQPIFAFVREHDEWHEQGAVAPAVKNQAIAKLEAYLLAQL